MNKYDKKLSWYFSRYYPNYNYSKINNFIQKGDFDPLYAQFETCYHFQAELTRIKSNELINDADFSYTAIAFVSLHENIFSIIQLLGGDKEFTLDYSSIIKECVTIPNFIKEKQNITNIDVELFKKLGIYNKNDNLENKTTANLSHSLLKNIRNKLIHPNSKRYNTINIGGNFSSRFARAHDPQKEFDFKSSFHSSQKFRVNKRIFLKALAVLVNAWESQISKITDAFLDRKRKHVKTPPINYDFFLKETSEMDKWSDEPESIKKYAPYKTYDLLKITRYFENNDIKLSIYNILNINKFFLDRELDQRIDLENFNVDISQGVYEYIESHLGQERAAYAHEKIGYWDDIEYESYFSEDYIKSIHEDFYKLHPKTTDKRELSLEQKIIVIKTQDINWSKINSKTNDIYQQILHLSGDIEKIKSIKIRELIRK